MRRLQAHLTDMREISQATRERVRAMFSAEDAREAEQFLSEEHGEYSPFGGHSEPAGMERIHFAAIRFSGGRLSRLRETIQMDWRDLLMASGFGEDIHAHEHWRPRRLDAQTSDRWAAGDPPAGVRFLPKDTVEVTFGPSSGEHGAIFSLLALEPEPRYGIELWSGQQIEVLQRSLQSAV